MDIASQNLDSSLDSIFSPLPLNQVPSIPTGSQSKDSTLPGSQSKDSTLSPLTISAHDIQSCSLDFTELSNPEVVSNPHSNPLNASYQEQVPMSHVSPTANVSPRVSSSIVRVQSSKENIHTPPKSMNFSAVLVRVSAKKLREIQSPYTSFTSNSTMDGGDSVLCSQVAVGSSQTSRPPDSKQPSSSSPPFIRTSATDHSGSNLPISSVDIADTPTNRGRASILKDMESDLHERSVVASTPKALSYLHLRSAKSEGFEGGVGHRFNSSPQQVKNRLSQGILQTGDSSCSEISNDSLVVAVDCQPCSSHKQTLKVSKEKLLQRKLNTAQSDSPKVKTTYHVHRIGHPKASNLTPGNTLGHTSRDQNSESRIPDKGSQLTKSVETSETDKLIATCTAAATAAVAMATGRSWKPCCSTVLAEQHLNKTSPQADVTATHTAARLTGVPVVNTNTSEAQPTLKLELPHSSTQNGPTKKTASDASVSDLVQLAEVSSLGQNPSSTITGRKLDHTIGCTVSRKTVRPSHDPRVANDEIHPGKSSQHMETKTHGKGNKSTHYLFNKAAEIATRSPECVEVEYGTRGEQRKVRGRQFQPAARDTLHHKDILMRLGRLEEWQHADTMGKIKVSDQTNRKGFTGKRRSVDEVVQFPLQAFPDLEGNGEPITHTKEGTYFHIQTSSERPLNTQSVGGYRSSSPQKEPYFKPRAMHEGQLTKTQGQDILGKRKPRISKEEESMLTSGMLSYNCSMKPSESDPPNRNSTPEVGRKEKESCEPDILWNVSKVLSDVQLARQDWELQCSLAETEEHYIDMERLLQSLEVTSTASEFTDVSWKVSQLLLRQSNDMKPSVTELQSETSTTETRKQGRKQNRPQGGSDFKPVSRAHQNNMRMDEVAARPQESKPVKSQATKTKPPVSSTTYCPVPSLSANQTSKQSKETGQMLHLRVQLPSAVEPCTLKHHSLRYKSSSQHQHRTISVPPDTQPAVSVYHILESAVPIRPPCVMSSPQYLTTETNRVSSHTQTEPLGSERERDSAVDTHEELDRELESICPVVTVNVSSQTSFHGADKGSSKEHSLEITTPGVEASKAEDSTSPISSPLPGDLYSSVGGSSMELGSQHGAVVAIDGCHHHSPPHTSLSSHVASPSHKALGISEAGEGISSEELDQRLQKQLESRANEWLHQELMARVLSQLKPVHDPISSSQPLEPSNSCSTCSLTADPREVALASLLGPDGMQVFVDAGTPVHNDVLVTTLKDVVKRELIRVVQTMTNSSTAEEQTKGQSIEVVTEDNDQYNYTPPESYTVSSSSPSQIDTPQATPTSTQTPSPRPSRLSLDKTLTPSDKFLPAVLGEVCVTPRHTPPLSLHDGSDSTDMPEMDFEPVITPQESSSEDAPISNVDTSNNLVSIDCTLDAVPTPITTPTPPPISIGSPPRSVLKVTEFPPHPKEPSSSDVSTTSTSSLRPSLTPTPSSTSTDKGVSLGEHIPEKPLLAFPDYSVSEGEVPLSPGDVRWRTLLSRDESGVQSAHVYTTMDVFMELKDSFSTSSVSDDSQDGRSSRLKIFSEGEVNKALCPPLLPDPLENFLHKQSTSTPDDDSFSPNKDTRETTPSNNTLSGLQSIRLDESDQVVFPDVTPVISRQQRHQRRRLMVYSQPYGLGAGRQGRHSSPGEVTIRPDKLSIRSKRGYDGEQSGVSFPLSEGEVPVKIQLLNKSRSGSKTNQPTVQQHSLSDESVLTVNETRNGIDIISVSQSSLGSNSIGRSSGFLVSHGLDSNTVRSPDRGHLTSQRSSSEEIQFPMTVTPSHQPTADQSSIFVAGAPQDENLSESPTFTTLSSEYSVDPQSPPGSRPDHTFLPSKSRPVHPESMPYSRTPITLTIPTASPDTSLTAPTIDKPEHSGDYSSDFDFSSSVSLLID